MGQIKNRLPESVQAWVRVRGHDRLRATFEPRVEEHSYFGIQLKALIAESLGEVWYGVDLPVEDRPEFTLMQKHRLRSGARVFDIGAHQGIIALAIARLVGPRGMVVAVEPNAEFAEIAQANVILNEAGNVVVVNAAAGERSGRVRFEQFGSEVSARRGSRWTVDTLSFTVDELSATYGLPDVLMIDVEGYECQVLRGAGQTLARKPDCCVEIHAGGLVERYGGSFHEVISYFDKGEFEVWLNRTPNDWVHDFVPYQTSEPDPETRAMIVALARGEPSK